MNVIGHETIAPYLNLIFGAPLCHQRHIGSVIVITEKGLLTTITPLGNMMGKIWYNSSDYSCHTNIICTSGYIANNKYCFPLYPMILYTEQARYQPNHYPSQTGAKAAGNSNYPALRSPLLL